MTLPDVVREAQRTGKAFKRTPHSEEWTYHVEGGLVFQAEHLDADDILADDWELTL